MELPAAGDESVGPSRRVIIAVSWARDKPTVRLRDDEQPESRLVPIQGLRLNYRVSRSSPRYCLGYRPFRKVAVDYVDCLKTPGAGNRKCAACSVVDATFAANLHHAHKLDRAEIDPAIAEHLRQPNLLYLAAFRDGSVKVGTTTEKRRERRLTEQGAWRAVIVARADDGYLVRDLEDAVTAEIGISQSVSVARKLDGLVSPKPDESLDAALTACAAQVGGLLRSRGAGGVEPVDAAWSFPGSESPVWRSLHRYPLRLDMGTHDLEVVAACGRLVAVQRPGSADTFVADLAQLYGVELDLGDYESDELAVQDSLF